MICHTGSAAFLTALALGISVPASSQPAVSVDRSTPSAKSSGADKQLQGLLDRAEPRLIALYKDLHAHPEVGFQETRTAARLAAEMRKLGFTVTEGVGKTGLVAIMSNGPGPVVLVRTELDGLPMEEKTGLPYASKARQTVDGKLTPVAHACGHDIHMAWWLGAAEALANMKDRWQGTLMFIAQPSEETVSGARAMLADGLFTRWRKPDFGFAAHVTPLPAGQIIVKDGAASSASDRIDIGFIGRGAHGSMPHNSIDPIVMAAHFVSDVQTVISREKDPGAFGVVTVGSFQAGTVDNIIPDRADLKLTLRSHDPAVRKLLLDGVERTARASAAMAGAPTPEIAHPSGTNAVRNDAALTARIGPILQAAFGADVTLAPASSPATTASEDFSEFIDAGVPSVFLAVGGLDPAMIAQSTAEGKAIPVNHSPYFAPVPEPTIKRGAEALVLSVLAVASKR